MFHILSRALSPTTPKLHSLRNDYQTWLYVRFASVTTSSSTPKGNSFTVSYLIDTCGFPPERAASVSKHINFRAREKPDLVIEFFKSNGFSHSQALSVIRGFPRLLLSDPEKSLKPKVDFFKSIGFSDSDTRNLIVGHPNILSRSLQNEMIPCFDFFSKMFPSKYKLMKTAIRYPEVLCDLDSISALNMKLLRDERVPESNILRFIEYFPRTLKASPKQFEEIVQDVKELGFDPLRMDFATAIHVKIYRQIRVGKEGSNL